MSRAVTATTRNSTTVMPRTPTNEDTVTSLANNSREHPLADAIDAAPDRMKP